MQLLIRGNCGIETEPVFIKRPQMKRACIIHYATFERSNIAVSKTIEYESNL